MAKRSMRRFKKWLSNALRDVHAWTVNVITIVAGSFAQWLAGLDSSTFIALTTKEKVLKIAIAVVPGVLMHIATARQHQDADAIVKKLVERGVIRQPATIVETSDPDPQSPAA